LSVTSYELKEYFSSIIDMKKLAANSQIYTDSRSRNER